MTADFEKRPVGSSDGTHMVGIYTVEDDLLEAVVPFFVEGLLGKDKCFYGAPKETLRRVRTLLGEMGVNVPEAEEKGQLTLLSDKEPLLNGGRFDPAHLVEVYRADINQAHKAGWDHVRATAEMSWLIDDVPGRSDILYYEALSTELFNETERVHAICQYNTARMNGGEIVELLKIHPWALVDGRVGENPFWIDPDPTSYTPE